VFSGDGGRLTTGLADTPPLGPDAAPVAPAAPRTGAPATSGANAPGAPGADAAGPLLDPTIDAQFAERRARIAALKDEGLRMLRAGNFRRAAELCGAWTDLDLGNADAWRCLGQADQALGYHREAINAFRKAKQYDPYDRTLDASIERSRQGIVTEFLNRYPR
jgi:tetratricopeptide (TPR) repeat protein